MIIKTRNLWNPTTNITELKLLGKLAEEAGEVGSVAARCIIQGINECEPSTGESNKLWLTKEIADVFATANLCIEYYELDKDFIFTRTQMKQEYLKIWHEGI